MTLSFTIQDHNGKTEYNGFTPYSPYRMKNVPNAVVAIGYVDGDVDGIWLVDGEQGRECLRLYYEARESNFILMFTNIVEMYDEEGEVNI